MVFLSLLGFPRNLVFSFVYPRHQYRQSPDRDRSCRRHGETTPSDSEDVSSHFGATLGAVHEPSVENSLYAPQSVAYAPSLPGTSVHAPPPNTSTNQPVFFPPSSQVQQPYPSNNPHLHATPPLPSVYGLSSTQAQLPFQALQQLHIHGSKIDRGYTKFGFEVGESSAQFKIEYLIF